MNTVLKKKHGSIHLLDRNVEVKFRRVVTRSAKIMSMQGETSYALRSFPIAYTNMQINAELKYSTS